MMFFGFTELLIMLTIVPLAGGLPLGLPPKAEDSRMANIAPKECVAYLTWAGAAKPDPNSKNKTEQLLAEKEIQTFIKKIDQIISATIKKNVSREREQLAILGGVDVVKAALFNPGAVYVGNFDVNALDVGVVLNLGDQSATVKKHLTALEAMLGPQLEETEIANQKWKKLSSPDGNMDLVWGLKGNYLLFATQEESLKGIISRWDSKPPQWLTDLRKRIKVGRTSSIMYLNIEKGLKSIPNLKRSESGMIMSTLGLDQLTTFSTTLGFDEKGYVTKTLIDFKEKPAGIFNMVSGKPLKLEDLSVIPKDSTAAMAARFDAADVFQKIRGFIKNISPRDLDEFDEAVEMFQSEVGVDLNQDIFKSLGDVWRVYNAPSEGGLVFSGLTGVVSVKDSKKIASVLAKIEKYVQKFDKEERERWRGHTTVRHFEFEGQTVYFIKTIGEFAPVAPAWCVTDKEFVIALYPSHVKAYLTRLKSKGKKIEDLTKVPEVAKLFKDGKGPAVMMYQDSREIFKLAYPFVQLLTTMGVDQLQREMEGFDFDMSIFPSATPFLKHLGPEVATVTYKEKSIELVSKGTVPMNLGVVPVIGAGFMFMAFEGRHIFILADQVSAAAGQPDKLEGIKQVKSEKLKLELNNRLGKYQREYTLPRTLVP